MAGYLQSSGAISMSEINSVFDSRGQNLNAYRGTTWYTAAGGSGTFSSGAISFSDFYSKGPSPAVTISLASMSGQTFLGSPFYDNEAYGINMDFNTNGTWEFNGYAAGVTNGNWATPTTTGIGSSYWVKWTRTFYAGGAGNTASATSGWQQLSSLRTISVTTAGGAGASADYTVQISSDSSGTTILATGYITVTAPIIPS